MKHAKSWWARILNRILVRKPYYICERCGWREKKEAECYCWQCNYKPKADGEYAQMWYEENISMPPHQHKLYGIFQQRGLWRKLDYLFWRTLCPYPDQTKIGMWWYGASGRIASYFHIKHCERCKRKYQ